MLLVVSAVVIVVAAIVVVVVVDVVAPVLVYGKRKKRVPSVCTLVQKSGKGVKCLSIDPVSRLQ